MKKPESQSNTDPNHPTDIKQTFLFLRVVNWVALIGYTALALSENFGHNWPVLLPVGLYALVLRYFGRFSFRRGQGLVRTAPIWGNVSKNALLRRPLFVGLSFGLIVWMNSITTDLFGMYYVLFGHTLGMIVLPWSVAMVGAELLTMLVQLDLVREIFQVGSPGFWIFFSILFSLSFSIMITFLISSRLHSERLVNELKATKEQLEAALAKEQEVAVLRERDRMAREMHDVLGHALVLVAVKIEAAQRLQTIDPHRAAAELEATKELVRQSMADLRTSLADLRSPALEMEQRPVNQALTAWACQTAREGNFEVKCNFEDAAEHLPPPIQDTLWQVGREAVLNIVKHAAARQVELKLVCQEGQVRLSVLDDGIGIPHLAEGTARLEVEGHYGIRGMRERLENLGGRLEVQPGPHGTGTLLTATLPLPVSCPETPHPKKRDRLAELVSQVKLRATSLEKTR